MEPTLIVALLAVVIVLQLANLAVGAWGARKSWWAARVAIGEQGRAEQAALQATQQLEHLAGLYHATGLPVGSLPPTRGYAASADFLRHLFDAARLRVPRSAVECGSGLSTVVLARALQLNGRGHLWTIDHDPFWAERTRQTLRALGLDALVTVIVAPLVPVDDGAARHRWYDAGALGALPPEIDLLVVDGPPVAIGGAETRYPVGPALLGRLSASGCALFDDADRPGDRRVIERLAAEHGLAGERLFAEKGCVRLERARASAAPTESNGSTAPATLTASTASTGSTVPTAPVTPAASGVAGSARA